MESNDWKVGPLNDDVIAIAASVLLAFSAVCYGFARFDRPHAGV